MTALIKHSTTVVVPDDGTSPVGTDEWNASHVITGAGTLSRTNDTNLTLTLGGTPGGALLEDVSLTLGWTGTLAAARLNSNVVQSVNNDTNITGSISAQALTLGWTGQLALGRGGTGSDLSATGGAGQYLKQSSVGGAISVGTIPASDVASGAALTRTNDTNVTLTLGGSAATALLVAASLTLGWTGTLAEARGGTAQSTYALGDTLYSSATNTLSKLAGNTTTTRKFLRQTGNGSVSAAPAWDTIVAADVPGSALTKTDDTNVTLTLGGSASTALLNAASLTVGWTGTLAATRGGTGTGSFAVGDILYADTTSSLAKLADIATGNALISGGVNTAPSWGKITSSHITAAALTKTDDTNVTLTLGGSPSTALVNAASLTLGWTGTLGVTRGGTGTGTQFTAGSVVFAGASGVYSQDNTNFFWDNTGKILKLAAELDFQSTTATVKVNGSSVLDYNVSNTTAWTVPGSPTSTSSSFTISPIAINSAALAASSGTFSALAAVDGSLYTTQGGISYNNHIYGAGYAGMKTRATNSTAPTTAVVAGDRLMTIWAYGADGTNYQQACTVRFTVDPGGTVSSGHVPGRLDLETASNSSAGTLARLSIDRNGNIIMGTAALATNATDGFFYADSCAGTPSGTPTTYTGRIPLIYDSTNNKLYAYNGAWKASGTFT